MATARAPLAVLGFFGIGIAAAAAGAAEDERAAAADSRPVVIETKGLEKGEVFHCRIPVEVRHDRQPKLSELTVIAKAFDENGQPLASTGVSSGKRPLIRAPNPEPTVSEYIPVGLQFDLTPEVCRRIDSLSIVFARCSFGENDLAENCLHRIRFASATKDPLHLELR